MDGSFREAVARAEQYAEMYGLKLVRQIGFGNDGVVYLTDKQTAVKAVMRRDTYERERDAYRRLLELNIHSIAGFSVAELLNYHNTLQVIEIQQLAPPFLIDFGKAYLDRPPDFSEDALEEWEREWQELYPEDQWPQVRSVLGGLEMLGIYYFDPRPGNIRFPRSENR